MLSRNAPCLPSPGPGEVRVRVGAASLNYRDLIVLDAFSSDAIPVHLLTREAFAIYFNHLSKGGVLAVHISNRYLDLEPVCRAGAASFNKQAMTVFDEGDEAPYLSSSSWVLVTSNAEIFQDHLFDDAMITPAKPQKGFRPWTDDYSNVVDILKLN